jgi:hypothetical protein
MSRWRDVLHRMRGEGLHVLFEPEKTPTLQEEKTAARQEEKEPKEE